MNTNRNDTAAIESLRKFADEHGELQFAHLCTAALAGEAWAMRRMAIFITITNDVLVGKCNRAMESGRILAGAELRSTADAILIEYIGVTDTTRPDGLIARKLEI